MVGLTSLKAYLSLIITKSSLRFRSTWTRSRSSLLVLFNNYAFSSWSIIRGESRIGRIFIWSSRPQELERHWPISYQLCRTWNFRRSCRGRTLWTEDFPGLWCSLPQENWWTRLIMSPRRSVTLPSLEWRLLITHESGPSRWGISQMGWICWSLIWISSGDCRRKGGWIYHWYSRLSLMRLMSS